MSNIPEDTNIPEDIDEKIQDELSTINKNKLVKLWHLYEDYYTDLLNYVPSQSNSLIQHAEKKFDTYIVQLANSYMSKDQIESDIDKETKKFRVIKMMVAIRENDLEEVKQLFAVDNSLIFEKDKEQDTPILKACRICNAAPILTFLLEKGANVEDRDSIEQTPLIVATQHGCQQLVKILLEKGANIHRSLAVATEENHLDIARMLLDAGADPNEQNTDGETPLEIALRIHRGKPTELSRLFEGGGEGRGKGKKRKNTQKNKSKKQKKRRQKHSRKQIKK
jgi:ankyrin repeat protein